MVGCGLNAAALPTAPPAAAQNTAELQRYQQRLEQLFQRLDQNNDQRLERWEVEGVPYLERHFERLDQQMRGYLTLDDLRPASRALRRDRASRFFRQADRNGDGHIDQAEASAFPWLLKRFESIDSNGDGSLSGAELRHARWRQEQRQP